MRYIHGCIDAYIDTYIVIETQAALELHKKAAETQQQK
jgi:hypothetical protein